MKRNVVFVAALLALVGFSAFAQDAESDFQVTKTANAVTITKYVGKKTVVNIPATIQNTSVTRIGQSAFANNQSLTSVTIPASVRYIEDFAFASCINLISVTFGGQIMSPDFSRATNTLPGDLRDKFFSTNPSGTPGTYTRPDSKTATWTLATATTTAPAADGTAGLKYRLLADGKSYSVSRGTVTEGAVVIPAKYNNLPVTEIENNAFNQAALITSITIPNGITTIGTSAFGYCGFASITIPNSVKTIGSFAFSNCAKLTNITIPNSVTVISNDVFENCKSLTSVTFQGTIPSGSFDGDAFYGLGDLRAKFYATDKTKGTAGTYTRPDGTSTTWTKSN